MSEKNSAVEMKQIEPPERKRTYVYADGSKLEYLNVKSVGVRESGSHRLELADGRKIVVLPRWIAVELDIDAWTF